MKYMAGPRDPNNIEMSDSEITVEVAFATPESQALAECRLRIGATVADAIEKSGLNSNYADFKLADLPVGIWGRLVTRERVLRNGDRVEIYRQLQIDPREARRQLAELGQTMGRSTTK
jgi:putative ubiquitin-RnfH superfamily antitoxin RatB of RatAB toxin-antitoxin module